MGLSQEGKLNFSKRLILILGPINSAEKLLIPDKSQWKIKAS